MLLKNRLEGLFHQDRMIVFFTQMAQPDVLQLLGCIFDQGRGRIRIRQMSCWAKDPIFQVLRIRAVVYHLYVMVCLEHQIICLAYELLQLWSHMPDIGHQAKDNALALDFIAHTVGAVVRHGDRRHLKRAQLVRVVLFQAMNVLALILGVTQ